MNSGERAFYTLDRQLRLLSASPYTFAVWGRSPKEMIGKKLIDLFPFVDGGPVHQALLQALQSFRPVRLRAPSVVLAGEVEVEIYPLADGLQVSFAPVKESSATPPRRPEAR